MKKNLIALAVFGAFSGAALAQSNVTLYGIVDVGYQNSNPGADNQPSTSGINGGMQSGNRWGVRGSEALSPNLNAVFTIEGGFSIDTGQLGQPTVACTGTSLPTPQPQNSSPCTGASTANRIFGRQAFLGLSGNWGTAVAGRLATFSSGTGSFDMIGAIDPFSTGFAFMGGLAFSSLGGNGTPLRVDNAALYQSPTWGGFKFGTGYSFNVSGTENSGNSNNVNLWFSGASFAAGPFFVAATYDQYDIPGSNGDQKNFQIGATWDLKFVKLHAAYADENNQRLFNYAGITSGADAEAWMAGVSIPLFGGSLFGSYQRYNGDPVTLAAPVTVPPTVDERDVKAWGIGYSYPLSRRTNLYGAWGDNSGENTLNNSLVYDRKVFGVGIRHLF
jgi:GBP family porin